MHGLYSTESIKMQHHAWAIQYWVHQNATPCMGYTVLSPSKSNTMHGLYSTESTKIQHHAWAIQYWVHQNPTPCMGYTVPSPSKSNTMHGLYMYSTESTKIQHHAWAIQYWGHQNATQPGPNLIALLTGKQIFVITMSAETINYRRKNYLTLTP